MKILFLLRENHESGGSFPSKAGLTNSARMTLHQLKHHFKVEGDLELCFDANVIDKKLTLHRPDICVIEALWVPPHKLRELVKIHKKVKFIVRVHSEVPFLANEGMAMHYIKGSMGIHNVDVAFNSEATAKLFGRVFPTHFLYVPNIYEEVKPHKVHFTEKIIDFILGEDSERDWIPIMNIGCFGSIRPMKNQLIQAMAAISLANREGFRLHFHMNTTRLEQGGGSVLKNIETLFQNSEHVLIGHPWMERHDFLHLVKRMDLGMQVSLNESFNIVAADFVRQDVPIVVSDTIEWMPDFLKVDPENSFKIEQTLRLAFDNTERSIVAQKKALNKYNYKSLDVWENILFHGRC